MTSLRRIAAAAVLSGTLLTGWVVTAAAAQASADPGVQMHIEHGPFSSIDTCEISRQLNDNPTGPCRLKWDKNHPLGFYYIENAPGLAN